MQFPKIKKQTNFLKRNNYIKFQRQLNNKKTTFTTTTIICVCLRIIYKKNKNHKMGKNIMYTSFWIQKVTYRFIFLREEPFSSIPRDTCKKRSLCIWTTVIYIYTERHIWYIRGAHTWGIPLKNVLLNCRKKNIFYKLCIKE